MLLIWVSRFPSPLHKTRAQRLQGPPCPHETVPWNRRATTRAAIRIDCVPPDKGWLAAEIGKTAVGTASEGNVRGEGGVGGREALIAVVDADPLFVWPVPRARAAMNNPNDRPAAAGANPARVRVAGDGHCHGAPDEPGLGAGQLSGGIAQDRQGFNHGWVSLYLHVKVLNIDRGIFIIIIITEITSSGEGFESR